MQLTSFQVSNFRSVQDSGPIEIAKITTLVGRNESGKSNLLLALHSLNPAGGPKPLKPIKDFPRHRRLSESGDDTEVVETTWTLDAAEQAELAALFPRAKGVSSVRIGRSYKAPPLWVDFIDLAEVQFPTDEIAARVRRVSPVLEAEAEKLEEAAKAKALSAVAKFTEALSSSPASWASAAAPALAALRKELAGAAITLAPREDGLLAELENIAATMLKDPPQHTSATEWAVKKLPTFVYVDDYPELPGHQNVAEYIGRKNANQLTPADRDFEKLCKVADLDPQQLHNLLASNEAETRNQLTNRASAVVTSEMRRLWKDRPLKVRFNVDANHLDTLISDPNATYDVEVNLDERSRGFKWFFSFYVTFAADTRGGSAENAILLLDEPGLYLHMSSQGDLLRYLTADLKNQIIYTTHSPFMVPTGNLDAIRTVNIDQDNGTTVTNDPTGDSRTLFPLQAALGFYLAQNLFVGPANIVVEGVTDYWILSSISEYLSGMKRPALPNDLTITPAGGAQKVTYMVALLTSERLHALVLLDDEKQSRTARDEMVKAKLIREDNVVFVTEAFGATKPAEADIEDLLEPATYDMLVQKTYADEMKGKKIKLNSNIPRIVKRYEEAFSSAGLEFHKTRPARLLLRMMANEPQTMVPDTVRERFERLFEKISETLKKHIARGNAPFQ